MGQIDLGGLHFRKIFRKSDFRQIWRMFATCAQLRGGSYQTLSRETPV